MNDNVKRDAVGVPLPDAAAAELEAPGTMVKLRAPIQSFYRGDPVVEFPTVNGAVFGVVCKGAGGEKPGELVMVEAEVLEATRNAVRVRFGGEGGQEVELARHRCTFE